MIGSALGRQINVDFPVRPLIIQVQRFSVPSSKCKFSDIIDNHTWKRAPEVNAFLADSIRAHFAVGYFFMPGFQAIAEYILQEPNP